MGYNFAKETECESMIRTQPPRPLTEAEKAEGFRWEMIEAEWEMTRPFRPGDEDHSLLRALSDR